MPVEPNSNITAWLHLVAAHILVVEVLQPTAEFLLVFLIGNRGGQLGGFQHGVVDENRAVQAQGQRQGVARAGIHADEFAVPLQPDQGVEGFLFQFVDDDFANAGVESQQEAFDEVVSHGPRSGDFFDLQGYSIGLIDPHPDRKDRITADVLQDHDGHVRDGVHHQAADFHFDFHKTLQALLHHIRHAFTGQRIGARARHAYVHVLAHQRRAPVAGMREIQRAILRGAADPLAQRLVAAFHQDLLDAADQFGIAADLYGALLFVEDHEPASLLFVGDLILHGQRGGVGARRVLEAEQRIVLHFVEQLEGFLEIGFGLAGKAHDDVGGQRHVALGVLDPGDALDVLIAGIEPLHRGEYAAGTGLHGQVDVIAEHGIGVHGVHDGFGEVARVGSGVAHAADTGDLAGARQQRGEVPASGRGVAVAVHVLPEKLDFRVAGFGQAARFGHYAFAGAAAFRPAREGHHAIGARLVAAFDDGDVGAMRIVAAGERRIEGFVSIQAEAGDVAIARLKLHQHFGEPGVAGGACHQADVRRALENLFALLLRHASQHPEDLALARRALEILQAAEDLLFGLVANAAGVVEHQVGRFRRFDLVVTPGKQRADDLLGVVGVHLAAEGFEVESFPSHLDLFYRAGESVSDGSARRAEVGCHPAPHGGKPQAERGPSAWEAVEPRHRHFLPLLFGATGSVNPTRPVWVYMLRTPGSGPPAGPKSEMRHCVKVDWRTEGRFIRTNLNSGA